MISKKKRNRLLPSFAFRYATSMQLDTVTIIRIGKAIEECYDDGFLSAPESINLTGLEFDLVTVLVADDKVGHLIRLDVPYGVIVKDQVSGQIHAIIRGTVDFLETVIDLDFDKVPCPFLPPGCAVHDGFSRVYSTLRTKGGIPAKDALAALPGRASVAGHSLGAAIATQLAADCRAGWLLTFGSPRVGNDRFASQVEDCVANIVRLQVRGSWDDVDPITEVPPPIFGFAHAGQATVLDPSAIPDDDDPLQYHHVPTYLSLINQFPS